MDAGNVHWCTANQNGMKHAKQTLDVYYSQTKCSNSINLSEICARSYTSSSSSSYLWINSVWCWLHSYSYIVQWPNTEMTEYYYLNYAVYAHLMITSLNSILHSLFNALGQWTSDTYPTYPGWIHCATLTTTFDSIFIQKYCQNTQNNEVCTRWSMRVDGWFQRHHIFCGIFYFDSGKKKI